MKIADRDAIDSMPLWPIRVELVEMDVELEDCPLRIWELSWEPRRIAEAAALIEGVIDAGVSSVHPVPELPGGGDERAPLAVARHEPRLDQSQRVPLTDELGGPGGAQVSRPGRSSRGLAPPRAGGASSDNATTAPTTVAALAAITSR
jgi:hypothetical protein